MEEKTCRTCKVIKTIDRFSPKQGTCKDCRNARKREIYKEKGLHTMNYYTYEGGNKAKLCKININNEQFDEFYKLKTSKNPHFTARQTLAMMKLIII